MYVSVSNSSGRSSNVAKSVVLLSLLFRPPGWDKLCTSLRIIMFLLYRHETVFKCNRCKLTFSKIEKVWKWCTIW